MKYTMSLGDVTPVIYGGFLVDEETGESIFWYEPDFDENDHPEKTITCYRFTVEKDAIEDLNWLKEDDWESVGRSWDMPNILELGKSPDIYNRARVYEAVGGYYGFNNLDGYPDQYTFAELEAMYPGGGE